MSDEKKSEYKLSRTDAATAERERLEMAAPRNAEIHTIGLQRWELGRSKWLREAKSASTRNRRRSPPPPVDDEVIYDAIFSKPMGWQLPHPVPLAHMVELLEDEWSD